VKLHTVREVAEKLRVKPATVYSWIRKGKLAAMRVGRLLRITEEQIDNFVRSSLAVSDENKERSSEKQLKRVVGR
jgi:excisionase family DNA binding protein